MSFGQTIPVTGLNNGFLGHVTRLGKRGIVARQVLATTTSNIPFGSPAVIVPDSLGGTYQGVPDFIAGGGSAANMVVQLGGVAVREVKTNLQFISLGNNGAPVINSYQPGFLAEVLEEGSILVAMNNGTPIANQSTGAGAVYIRTALNGAIPAGVVGGFEAAADGGNTTIIPGLRWRTGVVDANGTCELVILNRIAA